MSAKKEPVPGHLLCSNCDAEGEGGKALRKCSKCKKAAYCSVACQTQHWKKGGHKKFCLAPGERTVAAAAAAVNADKSAAPLSSREPAESDCPICLDPLKGQSDRCTLPCTHVFHSSCVDNLQNYGASQLCPLCRFELTRTGAEKLFDNACISLAALRKLVEEGVQSWDPSTWNPIFRQTAKEVVKDLREASEQGSREATHCLGYMYKHGQLVPKNLNKAVELWKKNAKKGFANSMSSIGANFEDAKDDVEAARWYSKAVDHGHFLGAKTHLGILYTFGRGGLTQNYAKALELFHADALAGLKNAQCCLGNMYNGGRGVPVNIKEAKKWYELSAAQGASGAILSLGMMHLHHFNEPEKAFELIIRSAEKGHPGAKEQLRQLQLSGTPGFPTIDPSVFDSKIKTDSTYTISQNAVVLHANGRVEVETLGCEGTVYTADPSLTGHAPST